MAAREAKTKPTPGDVPAFLAAVNDPVRRADCAMLVALFGEITGAPAKMWGSSIVGFGCYRYTYASGHSGEAPLIGFSPRKGDLSIYLMSGFEEETDRLARLGKHKLGKACLYVKRLADIDLAVLRDLATGSVVEMRRRHPAR